MRIAPNWSITRDIRCACGCKIQVKYSAWMDSFEERMFIQKVEAGICEECEKKRENLNRELK